MTQDRAIRTRAALVAAAAAEFSDHSYAAASINRILDNSTCTKGALYFHFLSKQALADAVLDDARSVYSAIVEPWRTADVHPFDAIAGIIDDIAAAAATHPALRAETRLAIDQPPAGDLLSPSRVWETAVEDFAAKADQAGYLRSDFTAARFGHFLIASLAGHRFLAGIMPTAELAELPARYADTLAVAIAAAATPQYQDSCNGSGERGTAPAVPGTKDEVSAQ